MTPVNLTANAIALLSSGDAEVIDNPVLQIVDIRAIVAQSPNRTTERYRMLLSDGSFTQWVMLGAQYNDLIQSQKLHNGSIVQLKRFGCAVIQNRMIIFVIDLDVIVENCDLIGDPKQYPIPAHTNGNMPSTTGPTMNQPAARTDNPQIYENGFGGKPEEYA